MIGQIAKLRHLLLIRSGVDLRPLLVPFMPKGLTGQVRCYGRLFGQLLDFG